MATWNRDIETEGRGTVHAGVFPCKMHSETDLLDGGNLPTKPDRPLSKITTKTIWVDTLHD